MSSEFHRRGDVSILHLAEDSDYRAHQTAISVEDIQRYLQAHPEFVGEAVPAFGVWSMDTHRTIGTSIASGEWNFNRQTGRIATSFQNQFLALSEARV
jgi:hypothetical protein